MVASAIRASPVVRLLMRVVMPLRCSAVRFGSGSPARRVLGRPRTHWAIMFRWISSVPSPSRMPAATRTNSRHAEAPHAGVGEEARSENVAHQLGHSRQVLGLRQLGDGTLLTQWHADRVLSSGSVDLPKFGGGSPSLFTHAEVCTPRSSTR